MSHDDSTSRSTPSQPARPTSKQPATSDNQHRLLTPLSSGIFTALFIAQLASNVGSAMQAVGAQWLIGTLGGGVVLVALVQTVSTLPVMLLAVPSGALSDIIDRRKLLIWGQLGSLVAAGLLALFTSTGQMTTGLLLALTFALGCSQAVIAPSWQAVQPELVGRADVPAAMTLQAANMNISRAIGPALGGLVVAALGPQWVFAMNAVSFLGTALVLKAWRRQKTTSNFGAEHLTSAIRLAVSFVAHAPAFRNVLWRVILFIPAGACLWALLPVVARENLGMDAGSYGILLGALGAGAVAGAFLLPTAKSVLGPNNLVAVSTALFAGGTIALAVVDNVLAINLIMVAAGMGWIGVLATLNIAAQALLPSWVRARGIAVYLVFFMGGQAFGAAAWGLLATIISLDQTLYLAATLLGLGLLSLTVLPLRDVKIDLDLAAAWPEPMLTFDSTTHSGPVEVLVTYNVDDTNTEAFRDAMSQLRNSRRRTGAERWSLARDAQNPRLWIETFRMGSWEEHQRQSNERRTENDAAYEAAATDLATTPPTVQHLFAEHTNHQHRRTRT